MRGSVFQPGVSCPGSRDVLIADAGGETIAVERGLSDLRFGAAEGQMGPRANRAVARRR